ncbi:hypothetical protein GWI33_008279 [Rhynchophorus ferrugineus]|uniref:Uncharacterized protein n=1 Tax=Rhynchophorus ferrugineus TaxID=354439 RepID=A0A834MMI8_RHYFE|nr:hypothetical protein GWI33_008279 [Rhynchophorus ferrugineus]
MNSFLPILFPVTDREYFFVILYACNGPTRSPDGHEEKPPVITIIKAPKVFENSFGVRTDRLRQQRIVPIRFRDRFMTVLNFGPAGVLDVSTPSAVSPPSRPSLPRARQPDWDMI